MIADASGDDTDTEKDDDVALTDDNASEIMKELNNIM